MRSIGVSNGTTTPRTIYVIRHGEKPPDPNPGKGNTAATLGIDVNGTPDSSSLTPVGWQRAGALATLFAPSSGPLRMGLLAPTELYSPSYKGGSTGHRTHDTIFPLSQLLSGVKFDDTKYAEGDEKKFGEHLAAKTSGVDLVCWEHSHIPAIANAIVGKANESEIPQKWPGERFDVIWIFTTATSGGYTFNQVPQLLLFGDLDSIIPVSSSSSSSSSSISS
jgi:hypothetical protein